MSVKVRCTGCEKVLTAPDTARGKAIRCPTCETKVRVPAASGEKPKKKVAQVDSEDALATLDLRQAEDHEARICAKCGFDMSSLDEEETECPKCGFDSSVGGLGERAQKRRLKGPDPDKFYSSLWKPNWKFVLKNQGLAWRTMIYIAIASCLMFLSTFLYLYIPMWPPRLFFGLCAFISGMMIPGWLWFMDQEIIVATLTKKDKLKRINFDFFLCSALGVKFLAWNAVFALPVVILPAIIGAVLTGSMGYPSYVLPILIGLAYLPVLAMMPICMGHFVMPVQAPGWMVWKVAPAWFRTLKPTILWLVLTMALHLPVVGCLATAAILYGPQMSQAVSQMEENSAIARVKIAKENAGKKDLEQIEKDPLVNREYHKPQYSVFIVPGILWGVACLLIGFPAMYSCRVNGQFVYYFRESLDLIALAKEYKYVSKAKPEDEEEKPKTNAQVLVDAFAVFAISVIIGLAIGMVSGSLGEAGIMVGLLNGVFTGMRLAYLNGSSMITKAAWAESVGWGIWVALFPISFGVLILLGFIVAFIPALGLVALGAMPLVLVGAIGMLVYASKHWMEARTGCFVCLLSMGASFIATILMVAGLISYSMLTGLPPDAAAEQAAPAAADPGGAAMPDGMPAGGPAIPADPGAMPANP